VSAFTPTHGDGVLRRHKKCIDDVGGTKGEIGFVAKGSVAEMQRVESELSQLLGVTRTSCLLCVRPNSTNDQIRGFYATAQQELKVYFFVVHCHDNLGTHRCAMKQRRPCASGQFTIAEPLHRNPTTQHTTHHNTHHTPQHTLATIRQPTLDPPCVRVGVRLGVGVGVRLGALCTNRRRRLHE